MSLVFPGPVPLMGRMEQLPANPEVLVEAPGRSDGVLCYGFLGAPGWLAHQAAPSDFITAYMAESFGFLLS